MSRHRFSRARRAGFTIVELTIALVVIGVMLSGILKGQELINGSKIRAIADRQDSLRTAWRQFVDRYGAKPGDYAGTDIPYATPSDGNGLVELEESALAMEHLALAGLILRCPQCVGGVGAARCRPTADNSLTNPYDGVISIWDDGMNYALRGGNMGERRLQIHTGPRIPSNILAEVDRKIDDGLANSGRMVFNRYDPTSGGMPSFIACTNDLDGMLPISDEQNPEGLLNVNVFHYRFARQGRRRQLRRRDFYLIDFRSPAAKTSVSAARQTAAMASPIFQTAASRLVFCVDTTSRSSFSQASPYSVKRPR